jgi:DNA-binding transcriptional ArsR family regulator
MPKSATFKMSREALEILARRFKSLAEPTRLKLLSHLFDGEKVVTELVGLAGISQPNASKHLSMLAEDGVLAKRREGLHIYYRIADDSVKTICESVYRSLGKKLTERSKMFR